MVPAAQDLNGKRCVFRVDASVAIGTGHVARCLTLAQALQRTGCEVGFVCRRLEGDAVDRIRAQDYDVAVLETAARHGAADTDNAHAGWLEAGWQQDCEQTLAALGDGGTVDWLIVDHYALDARWQQPLRTACRRILVIDDLADRDHDADILLDQNYFPDLEQRYDKRVPAACLRLLGPAYTLLREEFIEHRITTPRTGRLAGILVFFGGADASNQTAKTLEALDGLDALRITVIIGAINPHRESIQRACAARPNLSCLVDVDHIAVLMRAADLAIGAGGTTTWERCYLGLPAIVLSLAHNQQAVNRAVHERGACLHLGDTTVDAARIRAAVETLQQAPQQLQQMSAAALAIMQDHSGCGGVIAAMESVDD